MARLRPARPDEIPRIRGIEASAGHRFADIGMAEIAAAEPTAAALLAERIAEGRLIVAVDEADAPVGAILFTEVDGTAHIEEVSVVPDHGGRGIGAALIGAVAARASTLGLAALTLSTFRRVPWNAPYYRRLGFAELPDAELGPGFRRIQAHHAGIGLAPETRVFMVRPVNLA